MWGCHDEILVEEIENELRVSQITKPSMMQEKSPQELEFAKSEIACLHCVHALITEQADSNVRFSDH